MHEQSVLHQKERINYRAELRERDRRVESLAAMSVARSEVSALETPEPAPTRAADWETPPLQAA